MHSVVYLALFMHAALCRIVKAPSAYLEMEWKKGLSGSSLKVVVGGALAWTGSKARFSARLPVLARMNSRVMCLFNPTVSQVLAGASSPLHQTRIFKQPKTTPPLVRYDLPALKRRM